MKSFQLQTSQAHPWHGIESGGDAPEIVTAYIEMVPTDTVKYELDKQTGLLRLDRPQRFSSRCPTLYGFIPRTFCDDQVADRCRYRVGRPDIKGDADPLDICVLTEKPITHGNILVRAVPIGGFRMIDGEEADDKIIAVLDSDLVYGELEHIAQCPKALIDRLKHYFLTYKQIPFEGKRKVEIAEVYDRPEALEVIRASQRDYDRVFLGKGEKTKKKPARRLAARTPPRKSRR
jgi:inorganic pyrophosphatase